MGTNVHVIKVVLALLAAIALSVAPACDSGGDGDGADDRHIFTLDADGVSFASTQALHRRVQELERKNETLRQENGSSREALEELRGRIEAIERSRPSR